MNEQNFEKFKSRAYGFAVIKAINSNYNADFSGQPRTLPNGKVYATDKALKYTVRNFLKDKDERIFFFKRLRNIVTLPPFTLHEAYEEMFREFKKVKIKEKNEYVKSNIIKNLLDCLDIRLFGATFSAQKSTSDKVSVSIYGPVQINHGVNIWGEGNIFSEQIMSPFRNPSEKSKDAEASTLGRQSKLEEGHYVHHFSINPKNLEDIVSHGQEGTQTLSLNDIKLLKEALCKGATYYDSAAKAGTENEILFYVELNEVSKLVLPNFTEMVKVSDSKKNGKRYFDLADIKAELVKYPNDIAKCEIYYNQNNTVIDNLPDNCEKFELN